MPPTDKAGSQYTKIFRKELVFEGWRAGVAGRVKRFAGNYIFSVWLWEVYITENEGLSDAVIYGKVIAITIGDVAIVIGT